MDPAPGKAADLGAELRQMAGEHWRALESRSRALESRLTVDRRARALLLLPLVCQYTAVKQVKGAQVLVCLQLRMTDD